MWDSHFWLSAHHYSLPTTHFFLDNSCTNMITCPMLARKLTFDHPPKQANPFISIRLQPLCPSQKSQPQSNQHLPASFSKTPGVGGTPFLATRHSIHTHTDHLTATNHSERTSRQNLCG